MAKTSYTITKGGSKNDWLQGNELQDDLIFGYAGNDYLFGYSGNDWLIGGNGNDRLYGGTGNDLLDGGQGADYFSGGSGTDTVTYENEGSRVYVNLANNFATWGAQGDTFSSIENITASNYNDTVYGNAYNNTLSGLGGADYLFGLGGKDTLIGGEGIDRLYGGSQNDTLKGGAGADYLYGGDHVDTVDYRGENALGGIDLDQNIGLGGDTLYSIENVRGTNFADTISGNYNIKNDLHGEGGDDELWGFSHIGDRLYGGSGNDTFHMIKDQSHTLGSAARIDGGAGIDTLNLDFITPLDIGVINLGMNNEYGSIGDFAFVVDIENVIASSDNENIWGSNVANWIYARGGADYVSGFDGDDTIYGEDGEDGLYGGRGNDALYGGDKDDELHGEADNDDLYGGGGDDWLIGGDGNDLLLGEADNDFLEGRDDDDDLFGGYGEDELYGGNGEDYLSGDYGDDILHGGDDSDFLAGGDDNDELYGEDDNDELKGGFGNDWLEGGAGADLLKGGYGIDTASYTDSSVGVTVSLVTGTASDGDTLEKIENIFGSNHDDQIFGDGEVNNLRGAGGADTIDGGQGDDWLYGDGGADVLIGGRGNDILQGDASGTSYGDTFVFEHLDYGEADTIVDFEAGVDRIDLSQTEIDDWADLLNPNGGDYMEQITGTFRNDVVIHSSDTDTITLENVLLTDLTPSDFIF